MITARLFERPSVRAGASPVGTGDGASRSTNETLQQDLFNTLLPAPAQDRRTQERAAAFHASWVARSPMDH